MKVKSIFTSALVAVWAGLSAHSETVTPRVEGNDQTTAGRVEYIQFGNFDSWLVRNIKESKMIGGKTKTLYEIAPSATAIIVNLLPFLSLSSILSITLSIS